MCDVRSFLPFSDTSQELRDLQHFMFEQIDLCIFKAVAASYIDIIVQLN